MAAFVTLTSPARVHDHAIFLDAPKADRIANLRQREPGASHGNGRPDVQPPSISVRKSSATR